MTLLTSQPRQSPSSRSHNASRPVVCWETQRSFPSIVAASAWADVAPSAVRFAMRTGRSAGGYHFTNPALPNSKQPKLMESKSRWVRCVETGDVFLSMNAAAIWMRVVHGIKWTRRHLMLRVMESYQFGDVVAGKFRFEFVPLRDRQSAVKHLYQGANP